MRKILNNAKVKATGAINRAKNVLNNDRGDFYISDGKNHYRCCTGSTLAWCPYRHL